MKIERVEVPWFSKGGGTCGEDGFYVKKELPCFSVVQSETGSYGIALDALGMSETGPGGIFVAPPYRTQYIVHRTDRTGVMRMRWLFLDVLVNGEPLEDCLEFPLLLPKAYCAEAGRLLDEIGEQNALCRNLSHIYELLDLLLPLGREIPSRDSRENAIRRYVAEHCAEQMNADALAAAFFISRSTLYRIFDEKFGASPANYVNSVRLTQASRLLLTTALPVWEIGARVGFEDAYYFSKLFRKKFGEPPGRYRSRAGKPLSSL